MGEHLPQGRLTGAVIGAFFEVYNSLRFGFLEMVYARALELEFLARGIPHVREAALDVSYKGRRIALYRADFLVGGRLVVELKASQSVGDPDKRQLLNYLRATGMQVGLLLHFGPEARFHRVICSEQRSVPDMEQIRADR
jgi:GxxExxY protein